jgi:hypothetical protein
VGGALQQAHPLRLVGAGIARDLDRLSLTPERRTAEVNECHLSSAYSGCSRAQRSGLLPQHAAYLLAELGCIFMAMVLDGVSDGNTENLILGACDSQRAVTLAWHLAAVGDLARGLAH